MSKTKRQLKKEFTPKYYSNFYLVMYIIIWSWFLLGFVAFITAALIVNNLDYYYYGIMIALVVWIAPIIIMLAVYLLKRSEIRKRLLKQRIAEVKNEFADMYFGRALDVLELKKVITEVGFVANTGEYAGRRVVPFNEVSVTVYSANIYTKVCAAVIISDKSGTPVAQYVMDKLLYNFIFKKGVKVIFKGNSALLVSNKEQFVEQHLKKDDNSILFLFGWIGVMIGRCVGEQSAYRKTVLKILMES